MLSTLLGLLKMATIATVIGLGTPVLLISSLLPFKYRRAPVSAWIATHMCRIFIFVFNIDFECRERARFQAHDGFIFPNHDSYMDIILTLSVLPIRFLAAAEVRKMPFIGRMADAMGTVWVDRGDQDSRDKAREMLAGLKTYPPVILFPEGGIDGISDLSPFRYGAFEIVVENETAFLPAALIYPDFQVFAWKDESIMKAVWRLARQTTPTPARLVALRTVQPTKDDDPRELALETHGAIRAALIAYGGHAEDIITPGL